MTDLTDMRRARLNAIPKVRISARSLARFVWSAAGVALIVLAFSTPGFLSRPSLIALVNGAALVGCVAIGMSFVTISGNLMSFALGATASASAVVFMGALPLGFSSALVLSLAFGTGVTTLQGFLVGWLRANPIIVSMAAFALILGFADQFVGAKIDAPNDSYIFLKGRILGLPIAFLIFVGAALLAQFILSRTSLGHQIRLVGSSLRASEAAAVRVPSVVTAAYAFAGLFTALGGVLLAVRYDSGDMQMGTGFEYQAIAAVLVGGVAIEGGQGSIWRTFAGVLAIGIMNAVALLWGFGIDLQRLFVGIAVLVVVVLQGLERWR
jgi:ribose/xylose/arabinose/galactoside ABC-type transport system permease subunit